jgi:hypothetical protein
VQSDWRSDVCSERLYRTRVEQQRLLHLSEDQMSPSAAVRVLCLRTADWLCCVHGHWRIHDNPQRASLGGRVIRNESFAFSCCDAEMVGLLKGKHM